MSLKSFVSATSGLLLVWLTLAYFHPATAPAPKAGASAAHDGKLDQKDPNEAVEGLVVSSSPVAASHD